jgi:hypothetical protein
MWQHERAQQNIPVAIVECDFQNGETPGLSVPEYPLVEHENQR